LFRNFDRFGNAPSLLRCKIVYVARTLARRSWTRRLDGAAYHGRNLPKPSNDGTEIAFPAVHLELVPHVRMQSLRVSHATALAAAPANYREQQT
jgi:hypothetical protein